MNTLVNYHCVDFATGKLYVKDSEAPHIKVVESPIVDHGSVRGPLDLTTLKRVVTKVFGIQHGLCEVVHAIEGSGTMTMIGSCVFAEDVVKHTVVAVTRDTKLVNKLLAKFEGLGMTEEVANSIVERALVAWEPKVVRYNPLPLSFIQ